MRTLLRATMVLLLVTGYAVAGTPARAAAPARVLIVGDSITQGSANDYTWRYRLWKKLQASTPGAADFVGDRRYVYDNIAEQQGSTVYADPNFDQDHHAQWGRPLIYEKDTIGAAVGSSNPDVVLVLLGINDFAWFGATPAQVAGYMDEFIANVRAAKPTASIVIGHVLTRYDFYGKRVLDAAATADLNTRYDQLAAQRSTSTSRVVTARTEGDWDPSAHTWDGTHPNSTGEVRIAATFADALAGLGVGTPYGTQPTNVPWAVAGGTPTLTSQDRAIKISWPATPGANAHFIEQKIVSRGETAFTRLPYPVEGTTWTAQGLLAGWTVQFRMVPVKGLMAGSPGAAQQATAGGSFPADRPQLYGSPGKNQVNLSWSPVAGVTGYYIEVKDLGSTNPTWSRLPYPVAATSFTPGLLGDGRWYRWRVIPVNGTLLGPQSNTVDIRTAGISAYQHYWGLGDSYSSGLGARGDDEYYDNTCKKTTKAYAYLVPAGWEPRPNLLACAGAKTDEIFNDQLPRIPQNPGDVLITLTIGGNDAGFGTVITDCIRGNCTGQEAGLHARIDGLRSRLAGTFLAIRRRAPGADVVAAGYPLLVVSPPNAQCSSAFGAVISDDEKKMMRNLAFHMNRVIALAAEDAQIIAATTQVMDRFYGHEACAGANGEWVNQIAECIGYPLCPGTMHPTAAGHVAYAFAINDRRAQLNAIGDFRFTTDN
ncbi:GDSL-type esterase/lipase family protein [Actinoplanes sp. NPDC023936]|uniref:GDSL-type esterase/lipase family protein n=1 Tax=Actinoplanes sp. NPDC023936 TaxID=3154910 RepID=UPI0033F69C19